ncbi:MAG: hypothetical protein A3G02_01370 [Candidatus Yanofskybacteria bacterium RIFCSPLOWO2_12_FULL_44_13b]|uniref:Uncharacterized protein n=2 Tax=Candidatus Yanofskyibacteriota TaxID=1752733 RepID=A0A1F8H0D5_9BACT|nr:MAG: hypothetical protein UV63_C0041G0002 [Microgenomates group bacterium GW2011_GWC1_43_11]OGN14218.1 MAG: hypothetical protein A3C01_01310 [Candidatus Yanofskybacteria bacterium RIFCSPHIGHO2_02_FULL_44_36b]OGN25629.1 MAG: hypothetical protein A3B12_00550 [Candidatus Yanofskybacteria bacterium RIFCSPLOWO2_01_FULL_44_88]OGN31084.1 MAG: hypothetical protein A3I96_02180 [Candidatus Yanofskybacteria bacterium RIFCSPLOWO2_02_FULL_44_18]OGN35249.1 MAG: hypothetical protein A3G02_01370 [Candidatus
MNKFALKKDIWLPIAVLMIAAGFVYFFNLNNKLFWDDSDWIINNIFVHEFSWTNIKFWFTHDVLAGVGLQSNYYRPFLFLTFALNYIVAGAQPLFWHLTSNFIHIANAILVFFLLRGLELGISKSQKTAVAFLTALIFSIHPLQTEAVTYISGRGDLLVVFFMLLSLLFFDKAGTKYLFLSLLSLILALLSRETAIIFPLLALVYYVSFRSEGRFIRSIKQGLIKLWPYFAVVFIYGILRLTVLNFQNTLNFYSAPNAYSENLLYRIFTFMHVLVDYFKLLLVPIGLHMERSMTVNTSLFQWPVWLGAGITAGILGIGYFFYKKNITYFRIWLFGWGVFFIGLGPVSGITPINALIYEHWLYLPMIGFWFIVSFYLIQIFDNRNALLLKIQGRTLLVIALAVYLLFFSFQSVKRNILWGKPVDFYKDILRYEPSSTRINNNLGNTYYNQGNIGEAEFYYRKAIESGDAFAQPYYNLGTILQSRGKIDEAVKLFDRAIEINPAFYYPYQNLAFIYAQRGDLTKAADNIEKLKMIIPNNPRVYYNSALVYLALNNREKALVDVQKGLEFSSSDPEIGKLLQDLASRLKK